MVDKAHITPIVLKWARESAKITEETAASKVSVSIEKIQEWEPGESQPTIRQTQTLAKAYKRPFALFFLPDIPRDFQPLQDFRKSGAKPLTTSSIFIIREIQQKQAWISDVNSENKEEKDKPGGPNYFLLQLNRNSRLLTQTVLDAFRGGFIEQTLASSLLNVQVNKFQKLKSQMPATIWV